MNGLGGFLLLVSAMAAVFAVIIAAASCDDLGDTPPERLVQRGGSIAMAVLVVFVAVALAYASGRFC